VSVGSTPSSGTSLRSPSAARKPRRASARQASAAQARRHRRARASRCRSTPFHQSPSQPLTLSGFQSGICVLSGHPPNRPSSSGCNPRPTNTSAEGGPRDAGFTRQVHMATPVGDTTTIGRLAGRRGPLGRAPKRDARHATVAANAGRCKEQNPTQGLVRINTTFLLRFTLRGTKRPEQHRRRVPAKNGGTRPQITMSDREC
jgi:hypothetical protein